jgi:hypothetical protein
MAMECKNCGNAFEGNYCNICGQNAKVKRIKINNLVSIFLHGFFHLDKGFFYTIIELFLKPGQTLRDYLEGKRVKYFNPFTFAILVSLLAGFIYAHSGMVEHSKDNILASTEAVEFNSKHFNYRLLLTIPAYSFLCWILFRSSKYNFAEHFIINTYILSQSTLVFSLWITILSFTQLDKDSFGIFIISAIIATNVYQLITLVNVFHKEQKLLGWVKAFLIVLLGSILSFKLIDLVAQFL